MTGDDHNELTAVAAATAKVVGPDNNQLKAAAEQTVATATAMATATAINSKRERKKWQRR